MQKKENRKTFNSFETIGIWNAPFKQHDIYLLSN